jgi:hypothetical protein
MELQLDATITVLLISKISSTCFGQTFAHLQERKTETFTTCGTKKTFLIQISGIYFGLQSNSQGNHS